jgi:hypothetical protein
MTFRMGRHPSHADPCACLPRTKTGLRGDEAEWQEPVVQTFGVINNVR